jgi:hypothetical protein
VGRRYCHHEVFPLIARIIDDYSQRSTGLMSHETLVEKMVEDPEVGLVLDRLPKAEAGIHGPAIWSNGSAKK